MNKQDKWKEQMNEKQENYLNSSKKPKRKKILKSNEIK